jgi:hypothetical protein
VVGPVSVAVTLTGVSGDVGPVSSPHATKTIDVATKPNTKNKAFFIKDSLFSSMIRARI